MHLKKYIFCWWLSVSCIVWSNLISLFAANPIVPNIGLDDGHFKVYGDRIYNYACHDYSPENTFFTLKKWWIWSTKDLRTWTFESSLDPSVLGFPEGYKDCWATDACSRNGKYYWYVCNPENTYVVESDTPIGPWHSPLGTQPLMAGRDPGVFVDDDGTAYLITGVWTYHIARLNEDMISLAEEPRPVKIHQPKGPYNLDGKNIQQPTDDKPYLHKYNGKYYLSWGCFYAMSDHVYGPYTYKGCFITEEGTDPEFQQPKDGLTQDRHGSFFTWKNQTYFNCNDLSSSGAHIYWRNTIIMYLHYKNNGEIAPVRIDQTGVGGYDASKRIEAENYYASEAVLKRESESGDGFDVLLSSDAARLYYPHIEGMPESAKVSIYVKSDQPCEVEFRSDGPDEVLLGCCKVPATGGAYREVQGHLKNSAGEQGVVVRVKDLVAPSAPLRLDWIAFN